MTRGNGPQPECKDLSERRYLKTIPKGESTISQSVSWEIWNVEGAGR